MNTLKDRKNSMELVSLFVRTGNEKWTGSKDKPSYCLQRTFLILLLLIPGYLLAQPRPSFPDRGELIYQNDFSAEADLKRWIMEGPGIMEFNNGWMHMHSPGETWHHVLWCPEDFPASFIAEWEMQNMNPRAGLCIVFFATTGLNGEDIFDPSLPKRDGTFHFYIKDKLKGYHISYYANSPVNTEREASHLRKNNMFELVQYGPEGIPKQSTKTHLVRLIKDGARIALFIDDDKIIDWTDDGISHGPVYQGGKIGFRQMQWTHFRYRNLRVWEIKTAAK
jgi:hypothetical protein